MPDFVLLVNSHLAEMEEISTKLRYVEFNFPWMILVQAIQVFEHLLFIFTGVESQYDSENLVLLIREVSIKFTALTTELIGKR